MNDTSSNKKKSQGRPQESALWSMTNAAKHLGVDISFYRRHILCIPGHPPPVDSNAGHLFWWRSMLMPWLDDPSNLIKNEDRWEETSKILSGRAHY